MTRLHSQPHRPDAPVHQTDDDAITSLLRSLVENLPEAVFVYGEQGTVVTNPAFCRMLGTATETSAAASTDWLAILAPAERDRLNDTLAGLLADAAGSNAPVIMDVALQQPVAGQVTLTLTRLDTARPHVMGVLRRAGPEDSGEQDLHRRSQLLQGIADATHLLISLDVREREILASLEILRKAAQADRVCIEVTDGPSLAAGTPLVACCVGIDRWPSRCIVPSRWRKVLADHSPIHESVGDLPAEERRALSSEGVRAVLVLPLVSDSVPRGHIRFDRMATDEIWNDDEVAALQTAANSYGVALAHVEALTELRESEARYRRLVENAPDFIYRMSLPDGTYEYASPAAEEMLGYSVETILNHPLAIRESIHPGWRGYFEVEWEKLVRGEAPPVYEYAIIHGKTGKTRWLFQRNVLIRDAEGKAVAIEGIVSDITARKRAELQARTQQSMLESIFRAAPVGICVVSDRVIMQVNDRFCEMTGYDRDELVGTSTRKLYATEEDYDGAGKTAYAEIRRQGASTIESHWRCKDGSTIDVLANATPLDPSDMTTGVLIAALDITERKREEARMAASLREKEALLGSIHRNVKDNLVGLGRMLDHQARLVSDAAPRTGLEASRDRIIAIAAAHEHLHLSDDPDRTAMAPYITQLVEQLATAHGSEVAFDITADNVRLSLDQATLCGLVLSELITDALRQAPPSGVARTEQARIRIGLAAENGRCRLTVHNDAADSPIEGTKGTTGGLTRHLVELLSRQLGDDAHVSANDGTRFEVAFTLATNGQQSRAATPTPRLGEHAHSS